MREHIGLYRGKREDNGERVEGNLLTLHDGRCFIVNNIFGACIDADGNFINTESPFVCEVDPDTVGECTGMKDKNGKLIFEGDVVSIEDGELWVISFGNCGGVQNVEHEVGYAGFHLSPLSSLAIHNRDYGQRDDPVYYLNALGLCVIGNIHDNPELLKGESNG